MSNETTTDVPNEDVPGDGTPVNEVPGTPTVVDEPVDEAGDDVAQQIADLKARVDDLEERETSPAPAASGNNLVEWDDHDEWGNPRTFFGVNLGPHPWEEGTRIVARLVPAVDGYDPDRLRPLGS